MLSGSTLTEAVHLELTISVTAHATCWCESTWKAYFLCEKLIRGQSIMLATSCTRMLLFGNYCSHWLFLQEEMALLTCWDDTFCLHFVHIVNKITILHMAITIFYKLLKYFFLTFWMETGRSLVSGLATTIRFHKFGRMIQILLSATTALTEPW